MFGRLKITALALVFTVAGFAATGSAAQTPVDSSSHADKAASTNPAAGRKQVTEPAAKDSKASNNAGGPELSGPAQKSDPSFAGSPVSNPELERYIGNSLKKDPTLNGTNVRVVVSEDRIELAGNVAKAKEKQTAGRIAQSFAGNKKLVNQITIGAPATTQAPADSPTVPKAKPQNQRTTPSLSAQPNEAVPRPLP